MPDVNPADLLSPTLSAWSVSAQPLADTLADLDPADLVLALPVPPGGLAVSGATAEALAACGLDAAAVAATHEPTGTAGEVTRVPLVPGERGARLVLLVGTGEGDSGAMRRVGGSLGREARGRGGLVTTIGADVTAAALGALVEAATLAGHRPAKWTANEHGRPPAPTPLVTLVGGHDPEVVRRAAARAGATALARHLSTAPSNLKNPAWMAAQARTVGRRAGLAVRVWSDAALRREGFGGLLAVGGGSATPPRLVQLDYEPPGATAGTRRVVLVGKGITFDTGGLDIKPAEGMLAMKTDMSGSAIVLAVLAACREVGVAVRVTGLLALAENAVSGSSYRPSDVITQYGGTTVEIGNTDAEGRIVMADALAYADEHLDPDVLIDIATLTGAARVALGRTMAPVYATDAALEAALVAAGESCGELLWPFPLVEDYRPGLDSEVADLNHIAPRMGGGSITAALFLREFAGQRAWAHLDIAGVGRSDVDRGILSKGPTGFGARLLLTWLGGLA